QFLSLLRRIPGALRRVVRERPQPLHRRTAHLTARQNRRGSSYLCANRGRDESFPEALRTAVSNAQHLSSRPSTTAVASSALVRAHSCGRLRIVRIASLPKRNSFY